jgi:hypothetical protein
MKTKSLRALAATLCATFLFAVAAFAGDPTGTWTWTAPGRDGNPGRPVKLTLQLKGGTLTGSVTGRNGDTAIGDATFKDDSISFTVTRTFNDNAFTVKYAGKLDADAITGTVERPSPDGGDPVKTAWKAGRVKDAGGPPK